MSTRDIAAQPGETVAERKRESILFTRPDGSKRIVVSLRALHKSDGSLLDPGIDQISAGSFRPRNVEYFAEWDQSTLTLTTNFGNGQGTMRLMEAGNGAVPTGVVSKIEDEALLVGDVVPGLDLLVRFYTHQIEIFKIVRQGGPLTWLWEVRVPESAALPQWNPTLGATDNYARNGRVRTGEGIIDNLIRRCEYGVVNERDQVRNGVRVLQVRETLSGRTQWRDPATRQLSWRASEMVFPVLVDVIWGPTAISDTTDDGFHASSYWWCTGTVVLWLSQSAWRFPNVTVPQGATINSATLRVNATIVPGATNIKVYGHDVDNAPSWGTHGSALNFGAQTKTTANQAYSVSTTGTKTINVTDEVQEIISRAGWASGNALRLMTDGNTGNNYSYWEDFSHASSNHATLEIDYTAAGGGTSITPTIGSGTLAGVAPRNDRGLFPRTTVKL